MFQRIWGVFLAPCIFSFYATRGISLSSFQQIEPPGILTQKPLELSPRQKALHIPCTWTNQSSENCATDPAVLWTFPSVKRKQAHVALEFAGSCHWWGLESCSAFLIYLKNWLLSIASCKSAGLSYLFFKARQRIFYHFIFPCCSILRFTWYAPTPCSCYQRGDMGFPAHRFPFLMTDALLNSTISRKWKTLPAVSDQKWTNSIHSV